MHLFGFENEWQAKGGAEVCVTMCRKSIWKCCCSNRVDSKYQHWAIRWHQVPQKMVLVTLSERWLYLSSHFPGSSSCKWAVLVSCFPCHYSYITQFKDILQCNGGFVAISVKVWSLLLVFKLCMWGEKKGCLHSSRSSRFWYFFLNSSIFSS